MTVARRSLRAEIKVCLGLVPLLSVSQLAFAADASDLSEVLITGKGIYTDGATPSSGGAYVPRPSMGPFGEQDDKDIPFSTLSIPQFVILNQQAHTSADLLKNDPSVIAFQPTVGRAQSYTVRGFGVGPTYGFYKDGLDLLSYTDPAIESIERVDVLKGAAAAFYGFAEPGGLVQFSSKLPLEQSFARFRVGYISDGTGTAQADAGTRIGDFGVRANGYFQNGDLAIDQSSRRRDLEALSADWRPLESTRFWINAEHNSTQTKSGNSAIFFSGAYASLPSAPDSNTLLGQPWTFSNIESFLTDAGVDITGEDWQVSAAAGYAHSDVDFLGFFDNPTLRVNGNFGVAPLRGNFDYYNSAYRLNASKSFAIGSAKNTLTFNANGGRHAQHIAQALGASLGLSNLYTPNHFTAPTIAKPNPTSLLINRLSAQIVTDRLDIGQFSVLAGAVRSTIETTTNAQPSGTLVSRLQQDKINPLAALLFHPTESLSLYGSFMRALQPGQTAPAVGVSNPLQVLPPFVGSQYELGAKASVFPGFELKGAVFQVEEANAVINPRGVFAADGTQRNRGLEFTFAGRVLPSLTIFGGFTTLTARIDTDDGRGFATDALRTPKNRASLFAEWAVPQLPQLAFTGGVYYVSDQIAVRNSAASVATGFPTQVNLTGYTTEDIGARYTWVLQHPLTASLNIVNVADKGYFMASGTTLILGDPRSIRLTLSTAL